MLVQIKCKRGTKTQTAKQIKSEKLLTIKSMSGQYLEVHANVSTKLAEKKIMKKLEKIRSITQIRIFEKHLLNPSKVFHIFSDIDSTLTHSGLKSISSDAYELIKKFRQMGCSFYFCSGRSFQDIDRQRTMYETGEYAIAENGGVVIGLPKAERKLGNRHEAEVLIKYLMSNSISFRADPNQSNRLTEWVILKGSISKTRLMSAARKSKARIEILAGNHTYHITAKGVNKGAAIARLTGAEWLNLDPSLHKIISMGDGELDYPMFEQSDYAYLVGSKDPKIFARMKKMGKAIKTLPPPPKSLASLYQDLFAHG